MIQGLSLTLHVSQTQQENHVETFLFFEKYKSELLFIGNTLLLRKDDDACHRSMCQG